MNEKIQSIRDELAQAGFLQERGAYAIVDGQFGSTGKGLVASVLAECFGHDVFAVFSNAGPNSGHTSYYGDVKIVLQQLPSYAVYMRVKTGVAPFVVMDAGAIIDIDRLNAEVEEWGVDPVYVHPAAAVVTPEAKASEAHLVSNVGSTGKGTGGALASKILRDPNAVAVAHEDRFNPSICVTPLYTSNLASRKVLIEISQGFSLSLNASNMYPYTTSRDCTVTQALADAGIHPNFYRDAVMVVRTFPIRVAGNSGPCYADQVETSWEELGVEPEITTVTKKTRRVFTWSKEQFKAAVRANRPGVVFVNFMNYLKFDGPGGEDRWLSENVIKPYHEAMGVLPKAILLGRGPKITDVEVYK